MNGNKVMMFHIGRSGSRVLGDLLQQHSALHWDHEAFVAQLQAARRAGLRNPVGNPVNMLRERIQAAPAKGPFGTEVKFFHLRLFGCALPDFVSQVVALGFTKFILLKRQNYLRKIVSSLIAHQTKQWHRRRNDGSVLSPVWLDVNKVAIDWTERPLIDHLNQFEADFAQAEAVLRPFPTLNLEYEMDILPNPKIGFGKVCRFLGLPVNEGEVRYGRSNPYPLRQLIRNYEEVAKTLKNTPFEWMVTNENE